MIPAAQSTLVGQPEALAPDPSGESMDFAGCYRRLATDVHRWARRLGGSWIEPDDVVQEVFVVVHRRMREWDGSGNLRTWVFRITHHVVRNATRKRRLAAMVGLAPPARSFDQFAEIGGPDRGALSGLESRQTARDVQQVLDRLSPKHRTVLALFELEELSTGEIAELLDQKVGTIRVWLHRARAEFLRHYRELESEQMRREGQA